jgi:DNA-binding MurR/RpiR family transcriptional regulator
MGQTIRPPPPSRRAAFLDRDGVLVEILRDAERGVLYTAFHPDQMRPTKGAADAVRRLRTLGYECIVVTNQPGPAKGHFPLAQIARMNARLQQMFENVSPNLVAALRYGKEVGARVIGIVGRDGGYTAQVADACAIIPVVNGRHTTPHTEAFQGLVCHLLVSHPRLKIAETKWESVK